MVSLSLLKLLENSGFGTIDKDLFWEKLGIGENGLYISDLGGSRDRGSRPSLSYQIYSRADSDVQAYQQLQAVIDFLNGSFSICELPPVPPITMYGYRNVTIMPLDAISAVGEDSNGRMIYSTSGQLYYGDKFNIDPVPTTGNYVETELGKLLITEQNKIILTENQNG